MSKENKSEQTPETKPETNAGKFQEYMAKLRESGLEVIDTTRPGAATGFVGGVRRQPKH
ncbi:MAG TPA: hypothetical protein VEI01_11685 [Terriglobales bacterium]|nr:hypothetical protein [Terriglobales bacterium]